MKTVRLYGSLGRRFGRTHRFDVRTPGEAIRALRANFKGFAQALLDFKGAGFRVICGKEGDKDYHELAHPAAGDIRIVPVVAGASAPGVRILVGAALVAGGLFLASVPGGQGFGNFVANVGIGLMISGAAEILFAPTPRPTPERPENPPSYVFDGAVNTAAQGNPVPICYGRLIVGSQVISAGLSTEQLLETI
jgi:predicted phage tail protein